MSSHGNKAQISRRLILASPFVIPFMPFLNSSVNAQSDDEVNAIIKSLAPIRGQTITSGYKAKSPETFIIDQKSITVDLEYRIDFEVYFDFDSAEITPRSRMQLVPLGRALVSSDLNGSRFLVAGHTDAVGSDAYNIDLSLRRARSVARHLIENYPITPNRLLEVGFGFRRLKFPQMPKAAANRRVEVMLIVP